MSGLVLLLIVILFLIIFLILIFILILLLSFSPTCQPGANRAYVSPDSPDRRVRCRR